MTRLTLRAALFVVLLLASSAPAAEPAREIVRYESDRLTVRAVDVPLDRLLAQIAAVTNATVRGTAPSRPVSADFQNVPLREGLARLFGDESFMLTYATDGTLRTIDLLGRGVSGTPTPVTTPAASPRPPFADEEAQAAILRRSVPVSEELAGALGTNQPAIGQLLHAVIREPRAAIRTAAREAALATFAADGEAEAAYLSTIVSVEDAVLATMLRNMAVAPGAAEEWMAALATRAPSADLRRKASSVLHAMQQQR